MIAGKKPAYFPSSRTKKMYICFNCGSAVENPNNNCKNCGSNKILETVKETEPMKKKAV
jgi:DNA-directed RNA polymerase subunit RPC12/RpoP